MTDGADGDDRDEGLGLLLSDGSFTVRKRAILDPARSATVVAAALDARLPAGTAPPDPEFWNMPEWWEVSADFHVLLERTDVPASVYERIAARGLWHPLAGSDRTPPRLLERAAAEARSSLVRAALAENPATPETALRRLADTARPEPWERAILAVLLPVNVLLVLLQGPLILGHWLFVMGVSMLVRMPSRPPETFRGWRLDPFLGREASRRAELRRALRHRWD